MDVFGLTDLAGNALFPVFDQPLDVEDPSAPVAFAAPTVLAVSGVGNDSVSIQFNVPMASWRLLDPASYSLEVTAGAPVDMTGATFEFDGNDTVTVTLADAASGDLSAASNYDVELLVNGANPLRSRQGVELAVSDLSAGIAVSGDVISGPTQAGSLAMLDPSDANSIVVVFEETVDAALALNPLGYDYNSGSVATGVVALTERAVRATFSAPVAAGVTLEIQGSVAVDTAGNQAPGTLSLVVIDDQSAPTIVSTAADIQAGFGGDIVTVRFDEELDPAAASMIANYTVSGAAGALRIGAARYVSNLAQVQLYVEDMVEGEAISVSVQGIQDLAGNAPGAALTDAAVAAGDAVVPTIESMFVDRFFDPSGRTIEVLFSEPIDTQFARLPANWSTSSFVLVQEIEVLGSDHVRLFLSGALGVADTVTLAAGLEDAAGNVQASLTVDPAE